MPGKDSRPRSGNWTWHPLHQLPDGLFVCGAQILTAWRSDLRIGHPSAYFPALAPAK
ncbi:hypothetical protein [Streptomyces chartreusis]|uniref:hypothetical protein n=1 Tax=Streptomyces chartreusis TaxID=1969 RepID=UPI0036423954